MSHPEYPTPITVSPWNVGAAVVELQELLCAHGFTLRVNGTFCSTTETAVRQFQHQQGLRVDGVVRTETWQALKATIKPGHRPLHLGYSGADVWELQGLLQVQGYAIGRTGEFCPATQQAVMAFQQTHHLKSDGSVDPITWRVLRGRVLDPPSHSSQPGDRA